MRDDLVGKLFDNMSTLFPSSEKKTHAYPKLEQPTFLQERKSYTVSFTSDESGAGLIEMRDQKGVVVASKNFTAERKESVKEQFLAMHAAEKTVLEGKSEKVDGVDSDKLVKDLVEKDKDEKKEEPKTKKVKKMVKKVKENGEEYEEEVEVEEPLEELPAPDAPAAEEAPVEGEAAVEPPTKEQVLAAVPELAELDSAQVDLGIADEMEHLEAINGDPVILGKLVVNHLQKLPNYYTLLKAMEEEALKGEEKVETPEEEEAESPEHQEAEDAAKTEEHPAEEPEEDEAPVESKKPVNEEIEVTVSSDDKEIKVSDNGNKVKVTQKGPASVEGEEPAPDATPENTPPINNEPVNNEPAAEEAPANVPDAEAEANLPPVESKKVKEGKAEKVDAVGGNTDKLVQDLKEEEQTMVHYTTVADEEVAKSIAAEKKGKYVKNAKGAFDIMVPKAK